MTIADGGKVTFSSGFAVGSDAAGDILYHNGTSYVRLGIGSDGQVLTVNDAANAPQWENASGGGGSGSMTTVKSNGSQVGGADIVTLDFSNEFTVGESPDTEINISMAAAQTAITSLGTLTGLTVDSTGGIKVKNGDTSAGFIEFYEDSDNGTNKVTLIGRTSTASDLTISLPAYTGTLLCSAGTHTITASAATDTPLINKGAGSQSATLQEWQNTSATKLLAVGPDGGLEIPNNVVPSTTTNKLYQEGGTLKFGGSAVNTDTQLSEEQVEDFVGGMFTGNTETRITATYQDGDGTIDLVVDDDLNNYSNTNSKFVDSNTTGGADLVSAVVVCTTAEYNALTADATTLYFIKD